jgi:hypothetical protein
MLLGACQFLCACRTPRSSLLASAPLAHEVHQTPNPPHTLRPAVYSCQINNGFCGGNATCIGTGPGTRNCTCLPGFSGDGFSCAGARALNPNQEHRDRMRVVTAMLPSGGALQGRPATPRRFADQPPSHHRNSTLATVSSPPPLSTAIDACATGNGNCSSNATCTSTGPGTRSCACLPGFSGNGLSCVGKRHSGLRQPWPRAERDEGKLASDATATSALAPAFLPAGAGFTEPRNCSPSAAPPSSFTAINLCSTGNGGCNANATCTSTGPGTRSCTCKAGFEGNGTSCSGAAAQPHIPISTGLGAVRAASNCLRALQDGSVALPCGKPGASPASFHNTNRALAASVRHRPRSDQRLRHRQRRLRRQRDMHQDGPRHQGVHVPARILWHRPRLRG